MGNKSRLSRRIEKQSRKNLFFSILGMLVVLFVIFKFGVPLLINFSLFVAGSKGTQNTTDDEKMNSFVSLPVLNPLPDATNSATIVISGFAAPKQTIDLEVNNNIVDKVSVEQDSSFIFDDITLRSGINEIRVRAITQEKKESSFSPPTIIILKSSSPTLILNSPNDGQSFSKDENSINVSGKTDSGTKVTVNEFWAIVDDTGNFSYRFPLQNGENQIKIVTVDSAGNKTEAERKVTYSP